MGSGLRVCKHCHMLKKELEFINENNTWCKACHEKDKEERQQEKKCLSCEVKTNYEDCLCKKCRDLLSNELKILFKARMKGFCYDGHTKRTVKGVYSWKEVRKTAINFNLKCPYTGEKLTRDNFEIDHMVPICKGGTNDSINLLLVTKEANRSKGGKDFKEWYKASKWYNKERYERLTEIYEEAVNLSKMWELLDMGEEYKKVKLQILKNNFSVLLRKRTSPATKERFKKKVRLKELDLKIKEIEECLK